MKQNEEKKKSGPRCLPGHAIMEIKDVSSVEPSTGKARLSDEAVEKGKEWTEFTRL
ncbi:MAG: hypothetical protein IJY86_01700 [Clostridia bacterium]|nr:hypothetical protein [Clostridia bacterium]